MRRGVAGKSYWRLTWIGLAVGLLLLMAVPTGAQTTDGPRLSEPLFVGQENTSNATTSLSGRVAGPSLVLQNQAGRQPALELNVASGAPLRVNTRGRVVRLNADLLDGKHAAAFALTAHNHDLAYLPLLGKAADADLLDGFNSSAFSLVGHTQPFASLTGVPAGLADGDDDTLGGLACGAGEVAKWDAVGAAWDCAPDLNPTDADTVDGFHADEIAALAHDHDTQYLAIDGTAADSNLLNGLASNAFALAAHNHDLAYLPLLGQAADSDLLDGLDSAAFSLVGHTQPFASLTEVPAGLADGDDDTLAGLACGAGEVAKWDAVGTAWVCAPDLNPTDADTVDGQHAAAFAAAGHDHDAAYLGIFDRAADADLLDGFNSSAFAFGVGGVAINSNLLDGRDWTDFSLVAHNHDAAYLGTLAKAADAHLLDGLDSTAFSLVGHGHDGTYSLLAHNHDATYLGIGAMAADSDLLDGLNSTAFSLLGHDHAGVYVGVVGTPTEGNFPTLTAGGELADSAWGPASFAPAGHDHDAAYLEIGAQAADSALLNGLDSTAFSLLGHDHDATYLGILAQAADSALFDGLDSTAFLGAGAQAADSDLLDGLDATAFAAATHDHGNIRTFFVTAGEGEDVVIATSGVLSLVLHCEAAGTSLLWHNSAGAGLWYSGATALDAATNPLDLIATEAGAIGAVGAGGKSAAFTVGGDLITLVGEATFLGHDNADFGVACLAVGSVLPG